MKDLTHTSKYISKLLRHDPEDLIMDKNGWISTDSLLTKLSIDLETLNSIVESNNKKRFAFNEDKSMIRANQGHSIDVDVELKEVVPPEYLYHGTSSKVIDIIDSDGIKKMSRNHVHLSDNVDLAITVGNRHTKSANVETMILKISARKMHDDGFKFYLSINHVYLTDYVPTKYFSVNERFFV